MLWAIMRMVRGERLLPDAKPKVVPWGAASVWIVFLIWMITTVLAGAVVNEAITGGLPGASHSENPEHPAPPPWLPIWQIASTTLANGLLIFLIPAWLRATTGAQREHLGLSLRECVRNALRGFVGCMAILPAVYGVQLLALRIWPMNAHPMQDMLEFSGAPAMMVLAVLAGILLAPAVEELMFRAVLQGWLTRVANEWAARLAPGEPQDEGAVASECPAGSHEGEGQVATRRMPRLLPRVPAFGLGRTGRLRVAEWGPCVLTSLIFAGIHWSQWPAPLALFPLSMALGWVYQRTGGLVAPIVMHASFNAISTVLLFSTLA
jgi:membrane protease YdiL (CAAX protease family)